MITELLLLPPIVEPRPIMDRRPDRVTEQLTRSHSPTRGKCPSLFHLWSWIWQQNKHWLLRPTFSSNFVWSSSRFFLFIIFYPMWFLCSISFKALLLKSKRPTDVIHCGFVLTSAIRPSIHQLPKLQCSLNNMAMSMRQYFIKIYKKQTAYSIISVLLLQLK